MDTLKGADEKAVIDVFKEECSLGISREAAIESVSELFEIPQSEVKKILKNSRRK